MSLWIILSWVFVFLITGVNVFVFLKLKGATEQMMQMAFPGVKNMGEAMNKMQGMLGNLGQGGFGAPKGFGGMGSKQNGANGPNGKDAQLQAAMNMLQQIQKGKKR